MPTKQILAIAVLAVSVALGAASSASAQSGYVSQGDILRNATLRRPTVSPYLSLFSNTNGASTPYYTYVKPLLDQDRDNRAQTERFAQLQQDLNQQSARLNAEQQRQQGVRPTGHTTVYMNYSHYFRSPYQQQGRR